MRLINQLALLMCGTIITGCEFDIDIKGTIDETGVEYSEDCEGEDCADLEIEEPYEGDDYEGEEEWLDALFADFNSLMPLDEYQADNSPWFSYTGDPEVGWTRTLDYLFTNGTWVEGEVMQSVEQGGYETLPLSDHAHILIIKNKNFDW